MGQSKSEIADRRAHTDASLDAERATSDADSPLSATDARRQLDDLIERDRRLADSRLLRFRLGVDSTLSRERSDSPPANSTVSNERESADQCKKIERDVTDALIKRERQRSDIAVEVDRSEHDVLRIGLEERRQDTDNQLLTERQGADRAVTELGEAQSVLGHTKSALAVAQTKEGRQHDILGTVAHDLRGPLNVISLMAESIAKTTAETSIRASADAIDLAAVRMERLISDLLDMVRIESGTLRIVKSRHNINALLLEVFRSYEPMFLARDITFTVNTPTDAIEAFIDYDRIVQTLSNVLGNAMKFTQGGGTVALHVVRQAEEVIFTVRDNGPGIPPSALPHIFERFWQIDSNVRRGLGLGLHICENIVQAHGGRIWAESEPGNGATFRFSLPQH